METDFNHYHCIYWVFTQLCNDNCDHCYNDSSPFGKRMSEADCMAIIDNLPDSLDHLMLSGGEPLAEKKLLYKILDRVQEKYQGKTFITLQFNGDLLNEKVLQTLIDKGVKRFSIASIDRYHKKQGARKDELAQLFESKGIQFAQGPTSSNIKGFNKREHYPNTFGFFGATEDMWLGGNWARGRAMEHDIWKKDPNHNFCAIHSGAIGFLGSDKEEIVQELSIQLWKINPCCPGTHFPMGDARKEKVADVVQRASQNTVFKILNEGDPLKMGLHLGVSEADAARQNEKLQNICLYCDAFMKCHKDQIFDSNGVKADLVQD